MINGQNWDRMKNIHRNVSHKIMAKPKKVDHMP